MLPPLYSFGGDITAKMATITVAVMSMLDPMHIISNIVTLTLKYNIIATISFFSATP